MRLTKGIGELVFAVLMTLVPWQTEAAPGPRYGIHTSYLDSYQAGKVDQLGTRSVRVQVYWKDAQPNDGLSWNEAYLNNVRGWFTEARNRSFKLFVTLAATPGWAVADWSTCTGPNTPDICMPNADAWYGFVGRIMQIANSEFPTVDVVFGIWNEPNDTNSFFKPISGHSAQTDYTTLFSQANQARNVYYPSVRLGGPELAAGGGNPNGDLNSFVNAIRPYLRSSDVLTVHWYSGQAGGLSNWMSVVNAYSQGQEVWLTETGAITCNDNEPLNIVASTISTFDNANPAPNWTRTFIYVLYTVSVLKT